MSDPENNKVIVTCDGTVYERTEQIQPMPHRLEIASRILASHFGNREVLKLIEEDRKSIIVALVYADTLIKAHEETSEHERTKEWTDGLP